MAEKINQNSVEYYYKHNRFLSLLKTSQKWKDLFSAKEALVSLILGLLSSLLIIKLSESMPMSEFQDFIGGTLLALSAGLIGMLGFLISGLTIISGSLSNKILKNIDEEKKFSHLMSIVFTFYFDGALIGLTLALFLLSYLSINTNLLISLTAFYGIIFICSYLFWFTIVYSVMLLGTSIRLLILGYFYENKAGNAN